MTERSKYRSSLILLLFLGAGFLFPEVHGQETYSFLVAGHAYGAHEGTNLGLHPPLLIRLEQGLDTTAGFIVLTGDIVNHSTTESWDQVAEELSELELPSYYVMGNHDNNETGKQVFLDKHGALYYAFTRRSERFIVLNSTEADRAISEEQLAFLEEQLQLAGDSTRSVFIFFHEILWNSLDKYRDVRSNSRSRYDNILGLSNYWEEVHPLLTSRPGIRFYVIGGDVGGNTDAVAAFYDRWDNVTLLASGMGEVPDENCLLIRVGDTVTAEPVALDPRIELPDLEYFSVPPAPDSIEGPSEIARGDSSLAYRAAEVPFATAYLWDLPGGLTGTDTGGTIVLNAGPDFNGGKLSVCAERDGFGTGPAVSLEITAKIQSTRPEFTYGGGFTRLVCTGGWLRVGLPFADGGTAEIRIYNLLGRTEYTTSLQAVNGQDLVFPVPGLPPGVKVLQVRIRGRSWKQAFLLP